MDTIEWNIQNCIDAKNKRRHELAMLPYEKKFEILMALQTMTMPLMQARGKNVHTWTVTDTV